MKYNVAVTGLNAGDTPGPGVPVARSLKEHSKWRGRIIGWSYDALEPGILDGEMMDAAYLLPYPGSGKDVLMERILYIHEKEHIDCIIPSLDAELLNFIRLQKELSKHNIQTFLPTEEQFLKRSKANLDKLCQETGIKVPQTRVVTDPSRFTVSPLECPLMVKGLFYEAILANSMEDVRYAVQKIAHKWGYPVLLQEVIEGEEFNAAALGDGQGKLLGIVCMKKLVSTDKGKGWVVVTIKNDELIGITEKIVESLNWRGALEVEAIYSKKENNFYLIEINPRFPAWIYLAKAAGINLPYMYIQLAMGGKVKKAAAYKTGIVLSNYTTNLIADLSHIDTLFTAGEIHYEKSVRKAVH